MQNKIFIFLILFFNSFLYSLELKNEKFNILAKEITTNGDYINALGDVVVYSQTFYLTASKAKYNKNNETLELFDNVLVIKNNRIQTQSDYAYLNLKDDSYNQTPVFLLDSNSQLWIDSKSSKKKLNDISLDESIISSCDCTDPAWSIKVSSADLNIEDEWLNIYNPRLYIKGIPVLYSPYFGLPTGTKRKSGLLRPSIGYSNSAGLYYSQPIFWAPKENYDFEILPQVRVKRGLGLYTHFRYADSPDSIFKFKMGVFKEKRSYQNYFDLKNDKHYGWNIDYKKRNIFADENNQDGIYTSINWLNDIEYITLEDDDASTSNKIESKFNYFYNTSNYYFGNYLRYYIDTQADSNDTTLQELPKLQFHKYNKEIVDNLVYQVDLKHRNLTRSSGLGADIIEFNLPVSYGRYIFDDYLYFNLENRFLLSSYMYRNNTSNYKDGKLLQNRTSFLLGTDLLKPYDNFLHSIKFNTKYTLPVSVEKNGDLYSITNNDSDLEVFPISEDDKILSISLDQYFYNKETLNQVITHKISQEILFDNKDELQNLENYLRFNFAYGSISNKFIYNVSDNKKVEDVYNFNYNHDNLNLNFDYYNSEDDGVKTFSTNAKYNLTNDYQLSYYQNYNFINDIKTKEGIGLNILDKCWSLALTFENEITPSTTTTSTDAIEQKIIYINLNLKPLGGVNQSYKIEDK
jgi:LPS-assembly protein